MLAYPDHHSASSLAQWRNCPKMWCLKYLWDWKTGAPRMWRGTAAEVGFAAYLRGKSPEEALAIAYDRFDQEAMKWMTLRNSDNS